jgi:hypothetical protein
MTQFQFYRLLQLFGSSFIELPRMFQRQWWSTEKIRNYQLHFLKKRLLDARNKVPLYQAKNLPHPAEIHNLTDYRY